jgi:hypothetical protein
MALLFFKYNAEQLAEAIKVLKQKKKEYGNWSNDALLKKLPLRTWQNIVERAYLPGDEQVAGLDA